MAKITLYIYITTNLRTDFHRKQAYANPFLACTWRQWDNKCHLMS